MSLKKMPPQAYTKETLQEAFEWWSEQPEDFRARVQDKDDLIGYYLKVRRGRSPVAEPTDEFSDSARASFSSELKGLVKDLDAFEGYNKKQVASVTAQVQQRPVPAPVPQPVAASVFEPSLQLQFPDMSKKLTATEDLSLPVPNKTGAAMVAQPEKTGQERFFKLDLKSKKVVHQTKEALNLSSDEEALRAIIALGAEKLKLILKP